MDIVSDDYAVHYNSETKTILCSGSFRLTGSEYAAITDILNSAADQKPDVLNLDLTGLKFLNSSGINTLSKFIIRLRKYNASQVNVKGNSEFAWQKKSLANFQKLLPGLKLEFD